MESILTLNDLLQVLADIRSSGEKWRAIGLQLGLHETDLKSIESDPNYPLGPRQHVGRLHEVISKWLRSGRARRAALIEALRSPSVGETQLADQLTKKYASSFPSTSGTITAVGLTAKIPATSSGAVTSSSTSGSAGTVSRSGKSKSSNKLETAVAGLKRKQLHSDNVGGDTPRKKSKSDEGPLYDPPSYAIKDFVTAQSPDLQCVRCKRVPRKPLRLKCCNTLYCEPCGVAVTTCPEHGVGADYKHDIILRQRISKLTVRCANAGCEAKCAVYQMKDHLSLCKADEPSTTKVSTKHPNTATSAKKSDSTDRAEPMDVSVASVTSLASTNQMRGVTNTLLGTNLEREPLQHNGGKTTEDPAKTSSVPQSLTGPQLPPLAEVAPTVTGIPTLSQLQSTLSAMITMMNEEAKKNPSSSKNNPALAVPTLKLPGGKEIQLGVSVKSQEQSKLGAPQLSAISSQVKMVTGTKQKKQGMQNVALTSVQPAAQKTQSLAHEAANVYTPVAYVTTPTFSLTTPTTATSTISAATEMQKQQQKGAKTIGAESLKLGKAFTLSPSQQAEIASYIAQKHSQTNEKKDSTSARKSLGRSVRPPRPSPSLTLAELENELKSVATKWRNLGHGLGQTDLTIEQISAENGNIPEKCLSSLLKKCHTERGKSDVWLWNTLLKTLRRDVVGEKPLADRLSEKYGINVKVVSGDKQQPSSDTSQTRPKASSKSSAITIGALLANLPSTSSSAPAPLVTPPTITPTSGPHKATPMPISTPPIISLSQPLQHTPNSSSINASAVPSTIGTPATSQVPTVGAALANMGQLDVFTLLQNSPILQSIPGLKNLSSPLSSNTLLQKLLEVARKATPGETAAIMKNLQQLKPPGASTPVTFAPAPVVTANLTTPTTKSTVAPSKVTNSTGKAKNTAAPIITPLAAKNTAPVISVIQKASASNTPMEVEVGKPPTTVASTSGKTPAGLASPTKSIHSKSPMSVAVEIPKVKLSGAAIAAAMVPKTATATTDEYVDDANTDAATATTTKSSSADNSHGDSTGDEGVKTRQKQKQKAVSTPAPDTELITLSDEDFSVKPRREVHCSKCNHIPMNPRRPKCNCNVVYCETCADAIPNCPLCGKNEGFEEDKPMRKRIWNLKVPCVYKSQGCDWRGELCKRAEHDQVCLKRSVPCKYKVIGCEEMVRANELSEHELECKEQHLQLAMDTVVKLVQEVKMLQDEVAELKET